MLSEHRTFRVQCRECLSQVCISRQKEEKWPLKSRMMCPKSYRAGCKQGCNEGTDSMCQFPRSETEMFDASYLDHAIFPKLATFEQKSHDLHKDSYLQVEVGRFLFHRPLEKLEGDHHPLSSSSSPECKWSTLTGIRQMSGCQVHNLHVRQNQTPQEAQGNKNLR